jgi:anti-sigma factor (TIGR02949 family)
MAKSITCIEAMSKLQAYLDNEVEGPTEEDIDNHLSNCRECFSRSEFEKTLKKRVYDSGSVEVPEDVQDRLASLIKRF